MATSGRLLCLCLVLGLIFESLGHPVMGEKRAGENASPSARSLPKRLGNVEAPCGNQTCQFGCCEDDVCRELNCEHVDFPNY
uniref:Teretoxin Tsu6.8 n=1 Tax=Terebra subulata TaxID=89435 RepID=T68_TERSU|nr:RecName: Full=Teretoxin Tsu6.8; Flags: Precursor [Terebra subulata]